MKSIRPFLNVAILLGSITSLILFSGITFAETFCVSNETDLQTALNTAASNDEDDTIQIVQGTYNGNFVYASTKSNSLAIEGGYTQNCSSRVIDPENTVLDGGGNDFVLALVRQTGPADFSVEGLTLQNGNTSTVKSGGGLHTRTTGHVTLTDNIFMSNTAEDNGGGAYIAGSCTLTNNILSKNVASHGGGVFIKGSATLTNNTFSENTANEHDSGKGGGAFLRGTSTLVNNIFSHNFAESGGGVCIAYLTSASPSTLTNNTFNENCAYFGGGASIFESVTLVGNAFTSNTGGGLFIRGNGNLNGNTFIGNTRSMGGGAYIDGFSTLSNNTFSENIATSLDGGGGIYLQSSPCNLNNNVFSMNTATVGHGGGGYFTGSSILTNNMFRANTANKRGGGAYFASSGPTVTSNIFTDNSTNQSGGGAYFNGTSSSITNNKFVENAANQNGGGVYSRSGGSLTNNIFDGNASGNDGGAIYAYGTSYFMINNTMCGNHADNNGGGVWIGFWDDNATGKLYNNVTWNNVAPVGADMYIENTGEDPFFPVPVDLFNNNFDQSTSGTYIRIPFEIDPSNLDNVDPLFVSNHDYHLTASSSCINAGDNNAPDLTEIDMDGNPRIVGGVVDIGAYEAGSCLYVNQDGVCGGKNPCYQAIQEAVSAGYTGAIVKISEGTYGETTTLNQSKFLTLQGGWDSSFENQNGETVFTNVPNVTHGSLTVQELEIRPE